MRLRLAPGQRRVARPPFVGTRVLTFDAASSAQTASAGSLTWSHTVGTRTNRALVVGVSLLNPLGQTVSSVTYGGVNLTFHSAQANGTGGRVEWWTLIAPASGAANIVVTVNVATGITGGATSWAGADQTAVLDTATGATGTGTAVTVTQASSPDRYVIDVVATAATSLTAAAGQTERWNQAFTGLTGAGSTKPGATSTVMGWTAGLSAVWVALASSVRPLTVVPPVTATAQADLGGLTATIVAVPTVNVVAQANLGGLTATVAAKVTVGAVATANLGALTATIVATPTVGSVAQANLGALTATVIAVPTVPATLLASLGALTATAVATPKVTATLTANLGTLTATIAAKVTVPATAQASLGGLTAHATATVTHPASLQANLGPLTGTIAAKVTVNAVAQANLGGLTATIIVRPPDRYVPEPTHTEGPNGTTTVTGPNGSSTVTGNSAATQATGLVGSTSAQG